MSKPKVNPVRGMHDILPDMMRRHKHVSDTAYEVARLYGFEFVATPMVEFAEVFKRSLGDLSDVVNKEMYLFHDRKGEELVLRPENTAAIARAFIGNGLQDKLPARFFYSGAMFRYERPQKGRQRQFHQIGVEMLGAGRNPMADVDVILCGYEILRRLGLSDKVKLQLNTLGDAASRTDYQKALVKYLSQNTAKLSEDSQTRLKNNPLRILDSKDKQDRDIIAEAPRLADYLNDDSLQFFDAVRKSLHDLQIPYEENAYLVRGLDYYCHTVFEFTTDELGAQGTVLAGGRYDGLVRALGGADIDGVGWAAGIERLALMINEPPNDTPQLSLIPIGTVAEARLPQLAHYLRKHDIRTDYLYSGNVKKRMQNADRCGAQLALVIGDDELNNRTCKIKDLASGAEITLSAPYNMPDNIPNEQAAILAQALQEFYT